MFCENCGEELPAGAQFCVGCGARVDMATDSFATSQIPDAHILHACPNCKAAIEEDARFCDSCGALLDKESLLKACPNCNAHVAVDACFCDECGALLDENAQAPQQNVQKLEKKLKAQENTGFSVTTVAVVAGVIGIVLVIVFLVFAFANPFENKDQTQDPAPGEQVVENEVKDDDDGPDVHEGSTDDDTNLVAHFDEDMTDPFWGVFTYASKSWSEAEDKADDLTDAGYDSGVVNTAEWEKLNPEQWYVVCTGTWATEADAKEMASKLKNAGYSDAYAKRTGEYVDGDDVVKLTVETAKGDVISGVVNRGSDDYVIADSSSYTYSKSQLEDLDLTDAELCIAWNEPFARLGHHFDNPDLQGYFESCSWYSDNHRKYSLSGAAASNNAKLRKIAESKSSSKRWEDLATK